MGAAELTEWIEKAGYSERRKELADLLGVSHVTLSRWEHGARRIPSLLRLALIGLETKMKKGKETK